MQKMDFILLQISADFEYVKDFLAKYGIKGGFGVAVIAICYFLYRSRVFGKIVTKISEKYIEHFMKKRGRGKLSTTVTSSDITNHDIFNYIDFWMYSRIPTFQFSTEYRTIVFRKYLLIYFKKHREDLFNYVNSKDYVTMDDSELWKGFLSLTNNIVYDYEREMQVSGIPQIIIDKMKSRNNDTISLTIDLIEGICTSQFYKSDDNLLKIYSILNIMLSILENTIHNSENVCNSINGQLKGLKIQDSNGKFYTEP